MSLAGRGLGRLLDLQMRRPRLIIALALLLAAAALVYTWRHLEFLTSERDLISPRERLVHLSRQLDPFADLDKFTVVIEGRDPAQAVRFLQALVPRLKQEGRFQELFYRVDPDRFRPWALLYLNRQELAQLTGNLREHRDLLVSLERSPDLTSLLAQINRAMAERMVGELFTGFLAPAPTAEKPMDLGFLIRLLAGMREALAGGAGFSSPWSELLAGAPLEGGAEEGYFWTGDKRYLLFFATPTESGGGFTGGRRTLAALRRAIAEERQAFPGLTAGVTGQAALNIDEMSLTLRDMSLATGLSLAGLAALLYLFWGGLRRPLLELIELLIALAWTCGLTTLIVGHLNILSVTFAPLLLGLGIDYGIHWLARFQEEEGRGLSRPEAIRSTTLRLGPAVLLAGLTAALSFFPLVLTGFRGLVELGIITSMGMLMTTATTLGVLPALTVLFDRPGRWRAESSRPLLRLTDRRALALLLPALAALALSVWGATGVRFDMNMLRLQAPSAESVVWERRLLVGSEHSSLYGALFARSLPEVQRKSRELEKLPTVSEVQSVLTLLPAQQAAKQALLEPLRPLLAGLGPLRPAGREVDLRQLGNLLGRIRFKMQESAAADWGAGKPLAAQMARVRELIDQLGARLRELPAPAAEQDLRAFQAALFRDLDDKLELLRENLQSGTMTVADLPRDLRRRFVGPGPLYLIRAFPAENVWQPAALGRFVADLHAVDPDAVGDPVTLYVFTRAFRDASVKAAAYAVLFIFLLLLVTFRNLADAALAMLPLLVGTVWTVGLMRLAGIDFNLANSIFLPLVVGAGVEYGIIILQRRHQQGGREIILPLSTGKGVILAGLTTTVGFASLAISAHRGIHSLGVLAVVGSLSILAAAVLLLPAVLQLTTRFSRGRAGKEEP